MSQTRLKLIRLPEPPDEDFMLEIYVPKRPLLFSVSKGLLHPAFGAGTYLMLHDDQNTKLNHFNLSHLEDPDFMERSKLIEIPDNNFPWIFRCKHLQGAERMCRQGCYFLEKGRRLIDARPKGWKCGNSDCKGHVFNRDLVVHDGKVACFRPYTVDGGIVLLKRGAYVKPERVYFENRPLTPEGQVQVAREFL